MNFYFLQKGKFRKFGTLDILFIDPREVILIFKFIKIHSLCQVTQLCIVVKLRGKKRNCNERCYSVTVPFSLYFAVTT